MALLLRYTKQESVAIELKDGTRTVSVGSGDGGMEATFRGLLAAATRRWLHGEEEGRARKPNGAAVSLPMMMQGADTGHSEAGLHVALVVQTSGEAATGSRKSMSFLQPAVGEGTPQQPGMRSREMWWQIDCRSEREWHGWVQCPEGLCDSRLLTRLAAHYARLVDEMSRCPDGSVSEMEIITDTARRDLACTWNGTTTPYPDACIHELFEAQADRTPDRTAVIQGETRLTFRQLNDLANDMASRLRGVGVKREELVAVCMERHPAMIAGLLGILKAGGAYVPMAPDLPDERMLAMLRGTNTSVMMTQEPWRARAEIIGQKVAAEGRFLKIVVV